jgi:excisionase family DNA binding protein
MTQMPAAIEPLLTVREVAAKLRASEESVYRWIRAGSLDGVRFAGSVRVTPDALHRFVSTSTPTGRNATP